MDVGEFLHIVFVVLCCLEDQWVPHVHRGVPTGDLGCLGGYSIVSGAMPGFGQFEIVDDKEDWLTDEVTGFRHRMDLALL